MKKLIIALAFVLAFGQAEAGRIVKGTRQGGSSLTLNWVLPTRNADGTTVSDLTAQTIYYSTATRMGLVTAYQSNLNVGSASATTKIVTGLVSGLTYCFTLTATTATGESALGSEICATAP